MQYWKFNDWGSRGVWPDWEIFGIFWDTVRILPWIGQSVKILRYRDFPERVCVWGLFPEKSQTNLPGMGRFPMFKKKNSLPSAQKQSALGKWNCLRRSREDTANMTWHVVWPLVRVDEVRRRFGHEMVEKCVQIPPRTWISILHETQTATGVPDEHIDHTFAKSRCRKSSLDTGGDFVSSLAAC